MGNIKQLAKGDEIVQQNGINNFNNSQISLELPEVLTKSDVAKLLELTLDSGKHNVKLPDSLPAEFDVKLTYNNIVRYKPLFMQATNQDQMFTIMAVIEDLPDSTPLVERLYELFLDNAEFDGAKMVVSDGDQQVKLIGESLLESLRLDPGFADLDISIEKARIYVRALISYGIMKCKILINPNDKDEKDAIVGSE
ncbi:hypothetical protein ACGIJG_09420 [Lacticaseibacillus rhamnosus]|uniref:hypothetical protein n=1 Tax=Lacticaseibacillus rhamnosus TaxID=47715 RepID=UPI0022E34387|nr:hypothetical protein [Lacticaseibacillus rhamnosus]